MKYFHDNILKTLKGCGGDSKRLLEENDNLNYLYMAAPHREAFCEWVDFEKESKVLVVAPASLEIVKRLLSNEKKVYVLDDENFLNLYKYKFNSSNNLYLYTKLEELLSEELSFDYVVIVGENEYEAKYLIESIKPKMNIGSRLIFACDNSYGFKYLFVAKSDYKSFSRKELGQMFKELGFNEINWYYPMPDYRMANVIYSEKSKPKKGDLSNFIAAYDYPAIENVNIAKKFEEINEAGDFEDFANSFLIITGTELEKDYIKYNYNREEKYRIRTSIERKDDKKYVVKKALSEEGIEHIRSFEQKRKLLTEENTSLDYIKADISADGYSAKFDFIEGESLAKSLLSSIKSGEDYVEKIKKAFNVIDAGKPISNIDAIFENFLIKEGRFIGIDYEWVEAKQPLVYTRYRALNEFYQSAKVALNISKDEFLEKFNIKAEDRKQCEELEAEFQKKVHGDNQRLYLDKYRVELKSLDKLLEIEKERPKLLRKQEILEQEVEEKLDIIKQMREVKRLTDNHVRNLETMITMLREESSKQDMVIQKLMKQGVFVYKVKRKIKNFVDKKYPVGTEKRKKLSFYKTALKNPVKYFSRLGSKEGRNLLDGYMKIGPIYQDYGKLKFEAFEHPKVSIVIPAYNQIEYTYTCLASIIENSKGCEYEVILADDLSTDATRYIDKYVENIVISRPNTNKGFLLNCNLAASKARGEYILFLNNDTKVCKNWLSSLIELIESDESIGMVGSKLVYPDGRLQEAGGIVWSDGSAWNYGRMDDPDKCEYNYVKEVDYISGAAIMIRADLWKSIGGFDERYAPAYCEDSDLAFEVRKAGYKVMYQPESVVIHFEGVSNGTDVEGSGLKRYQVENSEKLKQKWANEFKEQYKNIGNPDPFRARERSKGKKIILFVDHYVPTFDKDAGSKTTYQYLQMLVKKGYVVKFLTDNFLRQEPYTTLLGRMGIEVLYGDNMYNDIWHWIEIHKSDISLVYFNRPHITIKYIDFVRDRTDIKIIYYGHDLHMLREYREYELNGDEKKLEASKYWRGVETELMHKADISYYPSQVEVDYIHKNIDKELNVKAITAYVYDNFLDNIERDFSKREGLLFVGGFAHTPNIDAVKWFMEEIWQEIRAKLKVNFYIVGSNPPKEIVDLHNEAEGVIVKGYVSDEELARIYQSVRLVVVPLRFGAGIKGKVIDAMYNGLPMVSTSIGAEGIIGADDILNVADTAKDFATNVIDLYEDTQKLENLSQKASSYVKEKHSIDAVWSIIEEDF